MVKSLESNQLTPCVAKLYKAPLCYRQFGVVIMGNPAAGGTQVELSATLDEGWVQQHLYTLRVKILSCPLLPG